MLSAAKHLAPNSTHSPIRTRCFAALNMTTLSGLLALNLPDILSQF